MSKAVYIATTESKSGKSILSMGLMKLLLGRTAKIGYFRPIIDDYEGEEKDNHITTIISYFNLQIEYREAYVFKRSEIVLKKNQGKDEEIISEIIEKYKSIESRFDFILVEGSDFSGEETIIEWDINALIAKNLGIPTIIMTNGEAKTLEELTNYMYMAYNSFRNKGVEIAMVMANKISPKNVTEVKKKLQNKLPNNVLVGVIPLKGTLSNPTIKEIVEVLNGEILFGASYINNQTGAFSVGAMQLRHYLTRLRKNSLVITPGDRADLILGALQANTSANYPAISGIILTGGLLPEKSILKLIEGLSNVMPIIAVKEGTFEIANKIGAIKPKIYAENTIKITKLIKTFEKFIDVETLANRLITFKTESVTSRMFQYNLLKRAQSDKKHIVLPEGTDERVLLAAKQLIDSKALKITLLGDKKKIESLLSQWDIDFDLDKISIINPLNSSYSEDYAQTLYELRKHKGVNLAMAHDLIQDVSYFGTMMVYKSHADGMVSGAAHTTQHTIRPALQFIKTKPNVSVVSSVFFMCLDTRVIVYGDCAINPNPTAEQLAEIAISSAQTSLDFGIEPKIAMLSYSSGTSGVGEDVNRVREATELVKKMKPKYKIEGPIQYDAAVDISIGKSKLPNSEVAGQANVLIFPDLNTGNNTYKAVQRETRALAIGPILQGLNKPVNDLSRGCTTEDIYNTVIMTAIQSQNQ